jgi:alpha-tubulin suppressor-like RCC1 family protein
VAIGGIVSYATATVELSKTKFVLVYAIGLLLCSCFSGDSFEKLDTSFSYTCPADPGGSHKTLSSRAHHTCSIEDGSLYCWGSNNTGQIETGSSTVVLFPVAIARDKTWVHVSAGSTHTCAITDEDDLYCWGNNASGQLGDGTTTSSSAPVHVGSGWSTVSAGGGAHFTCGVKTDGGLYCWGSNAAAVLGVGFGIGGEKKEPNLVVHEDGRTWLDVYAGDYHACAIDSEGALWCWSNSESGEKGTGVGNRDALPAKVDDACWVQLSLASGATCAIRQDGQLLCFGNGYSARFGISPESYRDNGSDKFGVPTETSLDRPTQSIAIGTFFGCAINRDESLWCWGGNEDGEAPFGYKKGNIPRVQIDVGSSKTWTDIAVGWNHSCARSSTGELWCAGRNDLGQLGHSEGGVVSSYLQVVFP